VLDLRALEESLATVDTIRDLFREQRLFERARLRIAAVEDRDLAMAAAVAHPLAQALDHEAGLVDLVVGRVQVDRLATAAVGPQLLAQAVGIVRDDRVGGVEDVGAGAVVLLELDRLRPRKILQET